MGRRSVAAKLYRSFVTREAYRVSSPYRMQVSNSNASPAASIARSDTLSAHVNRNVGSNQQGLLCIRKDRICLFVVRGIHSSDLRKPRIQYARSTSRASIKQALQGRSGKAFKAGSVAQGGLPSPTTSFGHHFSYLPFSLTNLHSSFIIHTIHHLSVLRYQSISNRQCLFIISTR